jgi:hypothetical protein
VRPLSSLVKKLTRMSLEECRVRTAQALRKSAERWGGLYQGELTDESLRQLLRKDLRQGFFDQRSMAWALTPGSAGGRAFMPGLADRDGLVHLMSSRFPEERSALLGRADRACQGRFDFFGRHAWHFGDPIDWCLEPTTGKRTTLDHWTQIPYLDGAAVGDKKIVWELNRHAHFVTLGQAYWLTKDERYAEAFVRQAQAWMDANPPRRGINWASSLEVAFRAMAWLWALSLFAGSERLTASFHTRALKALTQHGLYIESYLSHYFSPNTHLTGEALGLFYLGTALTGLAVSDTWRDLGLRLLVEQLPKQVRRDGVYFEQSSYYHRYSTDFYLHLVLRARAVGLRLPASVDSTLAGMLDHLMWITRPDGRATLYGDDDGGRLVAMSERAPDDFRDTLALGAALYGRSDWKAVAGDVAPEIAWLAGAGAWRAFDELEAEPPSVHGRVFDASGYAVLRDGWDEQSAYLFIDSGTHGALQSGHAHADALSFEFAAHGVAWIVDPGTYTYTGDAQARDEFRATSGHNTVTVDGCSQSIPAGPFSWTHIAAARIVASQVSSDPMSIEGSQDGYLRLASPVRQTRSFALSKPVDRPQAASYVVIQDVFQARERHQYELRLHLDSACVATLADGDALVSHPSGRQLLVGLRRMGEGGVSVAVPLQIEPGWVSRCYGTRQAATVLVWACEADGPLTLTTLLVPLQAGERVHLDQLLGHHPHPVSSESAALV